MLNIDTRTADKKTTYSTFCRAIAIRAVHPHSIIQVEQYNYLKFAYI
jgi:hypothetical protein